MAELLLSLVIPTRNRPNQCLATLQGILVFDEEIEIVIFDSSDTDSLRKEVSKLSNSRIHYIYNCNVNNITECFEAAVQEASGQYICMIGDDDGITPYLFAWARHALENGVTSVTTHETNYAFYNWPDIRSKYFGSAASGKLYMHIQHVSEQKPMITKTIIDPFLTNAGQGCGGLPRIYHGLIRRDVLANMREQYGQCFAGVSPDVSFSYLAAHCSPKHYLIGDPLTISGASAASNAGRSAMRVHKGDLWSDPHMKNFKNESWPKEVPEFFSIETIWAQAALSAIRLQDNVKISKFNFTRLYALLLIRHPDRIKVTLAALKKLNRNARSVGCRVSYGKLIFETIKVTISDTYSILRKIFRKAHPDPKVEVHAFLSIIEATRFIRQKFN
jgi:glycosyltransferase involved in cell wall biosynthesis